MSGNWFWFNSVKGRLCASDTITITRDEYEAMQRDVELLDRLEKAVLTWDIEIIEREPRIGSKFIIQFLDNEFNGDTLRAAIISMCEADL